MYVWGCCADRGQQLWDPLELELKKGCELANRFPEQYVLLMAEPSLLSPATAMILRQRLTLPRVA